MLSGDFISFFTDFRLTIRTEKAKSEKSDDKMAVKCQTMETNPRNSLYDPLFKPQHYSGGLLMVALLTGVCRFLEIGNRVENEAVVLLYLLPVIFSAYWWGSRPSYLTALAGVVAFEFVILEANWRIMLAGDNHLWSLASFFLVAFLIGDKAGCLREDAVSARMQESSIRNLLKSGKNLSGYSTDLQSFTAEMAKQSALAINRKVSVLLRSEKDWLLIWGEYDPTLSVDEQSQFTAPQTLPDRLEAAAADWTYQYGRISESASKEMNDSNVIFVPLLVKNSVLGILRINVGEKNLTAEEKGLVDLWASLSAAELEGFLSNQKLLAA